jgi:ATP-dependent RNA helicase DDX54/DBP10
MSGSDTFVMARTGSGKTCAFLIPMIEKLLQDKEKRDASSVQTSGVKAIILSPTRELSNQTLRVLNKLIPRGTLNAIGIHGGEGMEKQFSLLASRPDIIIATPGRLAHHLNEIPDFTIQECVMFICDEADRLFEMGFAEQLRQIARKLPSHSVCQKVLVSATLPKVLVEFSKSGFCVDPVVVRLDQEATVSEYRERCSTVVYSPSIYFQSGERKRQTEGSMQNWIDTHFRGDTAPC